MVKLPELRMTQGREFEHAILRVAIGAMIVIALAVSILGGSPATGRGLWPLLAWLALSVILLVSMWIRPERSRLRIVIGIVGDAVIGTVALLVMESSGAIIPGAFLFVIVGNEFRYGRGCMYLSQCLFLAAFAVAVYLGPWWREHPTVVIGWMLTIITVPIYVYHHVELRLRAAARSETAPKTTLP